MAIRLKQSTASQEIPLGVFVDDTDGKTAETGLTIANTDIKLWKTGATTLADKNSGGATHIAGGIYYAVLDATDTNTLGPMMVFVHVAGALPVRVECDVVTASGYDLEFAADALGKQGIVAYGTAQSATETTLVLAAASAFANDELLGATIVITGGTDGVGQARTITDYTLADDTATVDSWTTTPTGTITYVIFATPPSSATSPIVANVTQWNGSAVATPTTAGVPEVDLTHIAGAAVDATAAQLGANMVQISADATAADNLEKACDGTTYNIGGGAVVAASVTGAVGSVGAGGIAAATFAAGAIDAAALSDDAVDAILDEVVEGSTTMRQMLRGFAAALLSKVSGASGTTVTFRDIGDTKDRIVSTVDSYGNRPSITLTLT
jgi:hypothetical protein